MSTIPPPFPLPVPIVPPVPIVQHAVQVAPALNMLISALAPTIACVATNPFDTAKVRLQLQGERMASEKTRIKEDIVGHNTRQQASGKTEIRLQEKAPVKVRQFHKPKSQSSKAHRSPK